ncbi:hypothetical protein MSG28_004996 [Choristoneura fumiferana]|uniref:Uncharacterized protein n=1 Tax=Choristoneura fumiferana TaxID=7141 RepID=A0ACC0JPE5_CHOFU|nr:hypothetical protein MSG28_004996 [Choristoneura fumiferana]
MSRTKYRKKYWDPASANMLLALQNLCPGSWKPAVIKPKSLTSLYLSVMGPGHVLRARWTRYDYYHAADIAKHPGFDMNKKTFMYVAGYLDATTLPLGRTMGEIYKKLGYNVLILDTLEFTAKEFPVYGNFSFRICFPDQRLDPSDADFVLCVTTNMDGFGIATPVGHVTFYVNGGEYQPGDVWWLPCTIICSHVRSFALWVSALRNPHTFIGIQCDTIQQARNNDCYDRTPMVTNTMDLYTDRTKPGIYYLATLNRYPYFLGQGGIERKHEETFKELRSINAKDVLIAR